MSNDDRVNRNNRIRVLVWLVMLALVALGCVGHSAAQEGSNPKLQTFTPTPRPIVLTPVPQTTRLTVSTGTGCAVPNGWFPYQVQSNDTADFLATRYNIPLGSLLQSNCLTTPSQVVPGMTLHVPNLLAEVGAYTILPLGISTLLADPAIVTTGGTVTLGWQVQGNAILIKVGWLRHGQFVELVNGLPKLGTIQLAVPTTGQDRVTFVLRVGDGQQEVEAQTTVRVACAQAWFFGPPPGNCPTAPLVTTFIEQPFERGVMLSMPAMNLHYVMIQGRPPIQVADPYRPGMPLTDNAFAAPQGFFTPQGGLYYTWRQEGTRQALGYALQPERAYQGMMQRAVAANGSETLYIMSSTGQIYEIALNQRWSVLTPG